MNAVIQKKLFLAQVQQYAVDFMVDEKFATGSLTAQEYFVLETAMRTIRISFKYPAKVLQRDREITRFPATLWSHILCAVGLRKYAKFTVVMLNEHLSFPSIELPPNLKIGAFVNYDYHVAGPVRL